MSDFEYYYINSVDRNFGTASNFNITLKNLKRIHGFHIEYVRIPHTFYPIRAGINNQLGLNYNSGGDVLITVPEGNYNINDFITALQTQLQTVDVGFTATYSSLTGKITITHTTNTFVLYCDELLSASGNTIYRELGFNKGTRTASVSHTSDKPINISGFDIINLISSDMIQNQKSHSTSNEDRDVVCKPFINVPFGSTINYQLNLNSIFDMDINFTEKTINIRLVDQFYRDINLLNDWSMKLKLYKNNDFMNI